jgi:hypothetical protein
MCLKLMSKFFCFTYSNSRWWYYLMNQHLYSYKKQVWYVCDKIMVFYKNSHWTIVWYNTLIPYFLQGWPKHNVGNFNSSQWTTWKRPNSLKFSHGAIVIIFSK